MANTNDEALQELLDALFGDDVEAAAAVVERNADKKREYVRFDPERHRPYDNYCAINVDRTDDIPDDDTVEIDIDPEDWPRWKAAYGDDVEIVGSDMRIRIRRPVYGVPITALCRLGDIGFEIHGIINAAFPSDVSEAARQMSIYGMLKNDLPSVGGVNRYARLLIRKIKI